MMKKAKTIFVTAFVLFTLLGSHVTQAQELPSGYKWVSDAGPSSAHIVDDNGNPVDYQTIHTGQTNTSGPASVTEPVSDTNQTSSDTTSALNSETAPTQPESSLPETVSETADDSQTQEDSVQTDSTTDQIPETDPENPRGIDPAKPMIAFTFDDGPYAPVGNRIMDVMKQYNSRCTFFVVGERVPSYATEMKRMASEGFEIANHSQNHKYLNKLGADAIRSQVAQCNATIANITGVTPTLFRLPGGLKNNTVLANVNMPIILWNIDTNDWKYRNAQKTIDAVMGKVKDGDIVLMHELYSATADAVEYMVPKLVEQGYQLVTVSELIQYKGIQVKPNTIYNSFK